jgi:5-hydroxyisourate hydrolase
MVAIPVKLEKNGGMGKLTTHVLDTNLGKPAANLKIEVWRVDEAEQHIKTVTTNADGRVNEPLLEAQDLKRGTYELRFHAGDYLKRINAVTSDPLFLNIIPIRFAIAHPEQHYHVPLLLSAHGYATYRGS